MDFLVTEKFVRVCNPAQLHNEVRGAKHDWPASFVYKDGGWVYEVQRDDVDASHVRETLDKHTPIWPPDPDDEIADAIREATKDEPVDSPVRRLADALLGVNGGAKVPGRRPDGDDT